MDWCQLYVASHTNFFFNVKNKDAQMIMVCFLNKKKFKTRVIELNGSNKLG
jgi:hypothetical protein